VAFQDLGVRQPARDPVDDREQYRLAGLRTCFAQERGGHDGQRAGRNERGAEDEGFRAEPVE
jgi:hypothetical protein